MLCEFYWLTKCAVPEAATEAAHRSVVAMTRNPRCWLDPQALCVGGAGFNLPGWWFDHTSRIAQSQCTNCKSWLPTGPGSPSRDSQCSVITRAIQLPYPFGVLHGHHDLPGILIFYCCPKLPNLLCFAKWRLWYFWIVFRRRWIFLQPWWWWAQGWFMCVSGPV